MRHNTQEAQPTNPVLPMYQYSGLGHSPDLQSFPSLFALDPSLVPVWRMNRLANANSRRGQRRYRWIRSGGPTYAGGGRALHAAEIQKTEAKFILLAH